MYDKYFTIKDFPHDIYNAVGQIIEAAQEWEQEYKKLALMMNIPIKKVSKSSLNKLNDVLKKHNLINDKEYKDLKKVIDFRNYINHDFFISDYQKTYDDFEQQITELEAKLNSVHFLIYEATDVIENKIDQLNGDNTRRPTVFD